MIYLKFIMAKSRIFTLLTIISILCSCVEQTAVTLRPQGMADLDVVKIQIGKLKATFMDNMKYGEKHRSGYNGIAEMYHVDQDSNIFVPFYAGFNLEHIFGGDSLADLFEPRNHPMKVYKKNETEILLYQETTPISNVESLTAFKVVEPHYIDVTFQCVIHSLDFFEHKYGGFFWASYIHKPLDKSIYFEGTTSESTTPSWLKAFSPKHGVRSTHRSINDDNNFFFADNFNATLASHFSDYRFSNPFYFGKFHNMALVYMFKSDEVIRFSQSPTGGGETNPAWDFQYLIPSPKVGKKYSFKSRLIYKPFISVEDIKWEYESWINH